MISFTGLSISLSDYSSSSEDTSLEEGFLAKLKEAYPEREWRSVEEFDRNISEAESKAILFNQAASNAIARRKFANTKNGYYAMVPPLAEVGDFICLIEGAQTPFVLRRGNIGLQFVGECYVYGVMNGEIFKDGIIERLAMF